MQAAAAVCDQDPGLAAPVDRALVEITLGTTLTMQNRPGEGREHLRQGIALVAAGATLPDTQVAPVCAELAVATGPATLAGDVDLLAELAQAVRALAGGLPHTEVVVRHAELVAAVAAAPRIELLSLVAALYEDAREQDNLYTAWVAALGGARVLLAVGRAGEAAGWSARALVTAAELSMRENPSVIVMYARTLALTGEYERAVRALAVAESSLTCCGVPPGEFQTAACSAPCAGCACGRRLRSRWVGAGTESALVRPRH